MAARWQLHLGLVNLAVVRHCLLDVLLQCSVLAGEPVTGKVLPALLPLNKRRGVGGRVTAVQPSQYLPENCLSRSLHFVLLFIFMVLWVEPRASKTLTRYWAEEGVFSARSSSHLPPLSPRGVPR